MLVALPVMSTLAERVKEAITNSEVDISALAKACGISVQAVYKWRSGGSQKISGENLVELARLTGYEARWIIKNIGDKKKDNDVAAIVSLLNKLESRDRILIRGMVEGWIEGRLEPDKTLDQKKRSNLDRQTG